MQPDLTADQGANSVKLSVPHGWRLPLLSVVIGAALVMLIAAREWGEMAHQWWYIDTYSHILLVPVIIGWLVSLKTEELAKVAPKAWIPGIGIFTIRLT